MRGSKFSGLPAAGISLLLLLSFSAAGCQSAESNSPAAVNSDYGTPQVVGKIQSENIKESSGLAASRCSENVLWTHNDAGRDALIYALKPDGTLLGTWRVPNAQNTDWEDIAAYKDAGGKCFLYIGDIGDNDKARAELTVYKIAEPSVPAAAAGNSQTETEPAELLKFVYADAKNNAESLLVHPQTGDRR